MPLSLVSVGTRSRIKAVTGNDGVRKHLGTLGFVEGAEVTVISELNGNLVLGIMDSRVAIDKKLADRILV
jgi:ferrous iron transport protein A